MAKAITNAPDGKVSGLGAPTRGSGEEMYKLTAKWSTPGKMKNDNNPRRVQGFDVYWDVRIKNISSGATKTLRYERRSSDPNLTSWGFWLSSFKCTDGKTYTRSSFYPVGGFWCIMSVTAKVRGYNSKGTGPWVTATRQFYDPKTPSVEALEQNPDTGQVSVTIKQDEGKGFYDNHSTRIIADVYDSSSDTYLAACHKDWVMNASGGTSGSYDIADVYARMQQSYSQYLRVDVKAFSRGFHGRSQTVTQQLFVSWPQQPTIDEGRVTIGDRNDTTSKVTLPIETGYHPYVEGQTGIRNPHPTTGVRLEKLANVDYQEAIDIPGDTDWDECGAIDNGICTALSSTVGELQPERGKVTWVRVKSWNQVESIFFRYSTPRRMIELERPVITSTQDTAEIPVAYSGDDGKSAILTLGWPNDQSEGCEVSWSESQYAWRSNDEPDTYDVTWNDGAATIGGVSWDNTATMHVAGLNEGTEYHFRVRRYRVDAEGETIYGPYWPADATIRVTPVTSPKAVSLSAPAFVHRGSSVALSWTFDSEAEQTHWEVITGDTVTTTSAEGVEHLWIDEADTTHTEDGETKVVAATVNIVASGDDPSGSCVIDADRFASLVGDGASVPLAVRVSTGGAPVTSEASVVTMADQPTLTVTTADITAQPMSLGVECDTGAELTIIVRSQYVSGDTASGEVTQTEGDCVWSTVETPAWTQDGQTGTYSATITAPSGLALIDGGSYTVTVRATDTTTLLSSDEATAVFSVDYSHRAPTPSVASVVASDVTDADGNRARSAVITLAPPVGAVSGDLYDVFRMTPDGPQLCAEGLPLDSVVTDPWAPYGKNADLAYRVSCRTEDGVEEWEDFPYTLGGADLRIDFGSDYVELPYDLTQSDEYEKDFEARRHLDGSIDGYWNQGVARRASLSTNVIKVFDEPRSAALRRLALWAGPCYVRCPDGSAYQADVSVSGITRQEANYSVAVSLSATKVELTDYFAQTEAEEEE